MNYDISWDFKFSNYHIRAYCWVGLDLSWFKKY